MLGTDFARTLRAAQAGEEEAFVRLWRDANPVMIRYLRVVGHDDPYDEACEGWITVVRGLPGFAGDELAWRVWLLACARQRAEESTLRQAWGSVTVLPGVHVEGDGEIDIDELLEADAAVDPTHRGINDTLTALRALPLGQGEVVVLHLGAGLSTRAVAEVVGVDEVNIERAEERALERLGADAGLLSWSLAAPPTPAELADEPVAVSAFRKVLARGGQSGRRNGVTVLSPAAVGAVARRSRTAILTVTALSVSAMSLGGLGAAAYVGVLPDKVQQALHDAVGAPAPKVRDNGTAQNPGSHPLTPPTAAVGPNTAASPAAGLCRAWSVDKAKGTSRDHSVAFRNLSGTAGGADQVEAYCARVLASKPTKGSGSPTTGTSTTPKTPHPHSPTTKAPNPNSPTKTAKTAKAPNPNSPTKTTQPGKGKSAKTSTSTTTPGSAGTSTDRHSPNPRSTSKAPKATSTS